MVLVVLLTSCSQENKKPLVISTNAWIGYSPLFYAREMGWLKEANIELINVVSLGESMHLYNAGSSDVFTGTQHEFNAQREIHPNLIPIMLMDKSNGGDVILSSHTLDKIKNSKSKIEVYLEIDSINQDMLEYFVKKHQLSNDRLNIHNRVQDEILMMKNSQDSPIILIVTYDPYNHTLVKNGFKEIGSTRGDHELFVVDAIYTTSDIFYEHPNEFKKLRMIINRSIQMFQQNPKDYYEKVKLYLDNPSYDEFLQMSKNILWLNTKLSDDDIKRMEELEFPIKDIFQ